MQGILCLSVLIQELNKLRASCVFYLVTCSFLYTHKSWDDQESDRTNHESILKSFYVAANDEESCQLKIDNCRKQATREN